MLKSDYDWAQASPETLDAMADRCHEQGHDWQNACGPMFDIYMRCKWCGERSHGR